MTTTFEPDPINIRVIRQRDALLQLATATGVGCEGLADTLAQITEVASHALRVSRVSIWRYNAPRTGIDCLDLFDAVANQHQTPPSLRAVDFPNYFQVLTECDVVAVDDAAADPRTSEFTSPYLLPTGIVSMMDVPIHLGGAVIGVLCHEQTGQRRHWTADEKAFAIAASTLISLAMERCERHRAESAVELQSAALNAVAHPIVITDPRAVIVWVNPAFTALTGYSPEEAIGESSIDLLNPHRHDDTFFARIWNALLNGQIWKGEIWNRCKDGRVFLADQTVTPVKDAAGRITHFVAVKVDLTERNELEAQILQAQKMEIVGRLAGGIAHDFNNLLTVIDGSAELALEDLDTDAPLRPDFERIREAGQRATALTRQLLAFSRKQVVNREALDVVEVVGGFRNMLQRLIGEDIQLVVVAGEAGRVVADRAQMEQVILNLAINSRDAMPRGGTLRIEVDAVDVDTAPLQPSEVGHGRHVRIRVSDTGEGIPADVITRVFEPFFTTKDQGPGTGLGLATVCAIIEQSHGSISVASTPGAGATFTILLPECCHGIAAEDYALADVVVAAH